MDAAIASTPPNSLGNGDEFSSPASSDGCCSTLLVGGDRKFNVTGFEKFTKTTEFAKVGLSYAVVAIIGPQSSGKSTLINQLFQTNFKEMDAVRGRSETTKGIWVAKCPTIHPFTLVMDMEGTDGKERGEDTAFEKQSTLFALAVADVVLINMWCHDIGREQASNKPLLNTVFQVMMRLIGPRKTTLIFVIHDKTKTPLESLERDIRNDIQKIWESAPKPEAHKETPLSEFFNVEVFALSSYEDKEDTFKEEVACMRQKFFHHNKLAGDRQAVVPASGFFLNLQEILEKIKKDRDLDIPSIKVMVPTVRCEKDICLGRFLKWVPLWTVRYALLALIDLMPTYPDGELGSVEYNMEERRDLAIKSPAAAPRYGNSELQNLIDEIHEYMLSKAPPVPVPVPPQLSPVPSHEHSQNDGAKGKHSTGSFSVINVIGNIFNATNSNRVGISSSMNAFSDSTGSFYVINVFGNIFNATNSNVVGISDSMNKFDEGHNPKKAKRCWSALLWSRRQN